MSNQTKKKKKKKKKTVAQWREEKEQHKLDLRRGREFVKDVATAHS
jgi:hypothetical protein